jgi:hypothetical protein
VSSGKRSEFKRKEKGKDKRKLISAAAEENRQRLKKMSLKLGLNRVQEVFVIALMLVFIFGVLYSNIDFTYKLSIAVLVFAIVFLTSIAAQALKQEDQTRRKP